MHVLVVGGGGREHALAWRLASSPSVTRVTALPGNPGIEAVARCLPGTVDELDRLSQVARAEAVDLVVVGPEAPLVAGAADRLRAAGIAVFGPSQAASRLEGSKVFSKELFRDAGLPTAAFEVFDAPAPALAYLSRVGAPIVVKADGLCAGKGAVVCATLAEAERAVDEMLVQKLFGAAGERIVIEDCLAGPEVSVMAIVDGETVLPLPVSQDHKRAWDGDRGPNTGGMGACSPVPQLPDTLIAELVDDLLRPTARAMAAAGLPYQGVLYGGYMLTDDGPSILEYNCRFGDPEAQVILPRLEGDFGEVLCAAATGRLAEVSLGVRDEAAVCVVVASGGYPGTLDRGHPIDGLDEAATLDSTVVFHAGTARAGDQIVNSGGRVLGVTGLGPTIRAARDRAYRAVDAVAWQGCFHRRDIARQALEDGS